MGLRRSAGCGERSLPGAVDGTADGEDRCDASDEGQGRCGPVGRLSVRDGLLGLQVALCALLVTCALVGLRGLQRSLAAPLGSNPME